MKLLETAENATGTRYLFAWSYRKLNSQKELMNVMQGKTTLDIHDVQQFVDPASNMPAIAFQLGGEGMFKDFKESFRYTVDLHLYEGIIEIFEPQPDKTPWYKKIMRFASNRFTSGK